MNISIKSVPEELVAALKARAKANHRSLQGEILTILEDSVYGPERLVLGRQAPPPLQDNAGR